MTIQDTLRKLLGKDTDPDMEMEIPDDVTRDRYLRSLRRERRVQMELNEKRDLIKKIKEFKMNESRKHLWGFKGAVKKVPMIKAKVEQVKQQRASILQSKIRILNGAKAKPRKTGFLDRTDL